jgi:hypothetical protein
MARAVSRRPVAAKAMFAVGSLRVGFVVDKVALGQVFIRILLVFPLSITPPWLSVLIYHMRDEQ